MKFWKIKDIRRLAKLCCLFIFTDEFDDETFKELACRYLYQLGIIGKKNQNWVYEIDEVTE